MALRPPTDDDLRRLAEANHFQLNDEEVEGFQAIIPGLFDSYEQLDRMPVPKEPLKYPKRDPGQRPAPEDDPLNAIVRRCTLPGSGSGKLAGKRIGLKNNICVAGMPMPSSQPCPTIQRSRSRSLQIHCKLFQCICDRSVPECGYFDMKDVYLQSNLSDRKNNLTLLERGKYN